MNKTENTTTDQNTASLEEHLFEHLSPNLHKGLVQFISTIRLQQGYRAEVKKLVEQLVEKTDDRKFIAFKTYSKLIIQCRYVIFNVFFLT